MLIRLATPADLAAVDALFARAYPRQLAADYPPSLMVMALPMLSRAQPALLASGCYFLAERDGAVLGAGGWTAAAPGRGGLSAGQGHIRHVVTDDRATRQGIGRAVLGAAMAQARAAGIVQLHCLSTLTAVPFYSALGFAVDGRVSLSLGPGIDFPAVAMRRSLAPE
jgi:GNAT superfamily N-acetyltransferase